jgi:RHS repeat-associated protein
MHTMVTAPILTYSPNDITRAQSRAGEWNASFAFDVAFTATPSYLDVVAPNELLADSSLPLCNFTGAFCCNHQYSVTAITTSTGAIAERYAYTAYGQPTILNASGAVISATTLSNRYSYTGREWDATLALHHFRARWMSPSAGRFLGRDPIGFKGSPFDLVEYVKGYPLVERDPMGLDRCTDLCDAAAATCFVLATAACINAALHCHILLFCRPLAQACLLAAAMECVHFNLGCAVVFHACHESCRKKRLENAHPEDPFVS